MFTGIGRSEDQRKLLLSMCFFHTPDGDSQTPGQYHDWIEGTWGKNVKGVGAFWRLKMRHKIVQLCDVGHKALHITALVFHKYLDVEKIIKLGPKVWYQYKFYPAGCEMSNLEVSATSQREATQRLLEATHGTHWTRYCAIGMVYTENGGDMAGVASLSGHAQGADNKEFDILAKVYLKTHKSRPAAAILSGRNKDVPHYDVREMVDLHDKDFLSLVRDLNHGSCDRALRLINSATPAQKKQWGYSPDHDWITERRFVDMVITLSYITPLYTLHTVIYPT